MDQNYVNLGEYAQVDIDRLIYLKQIHSAIVHVADKERTAFYQGGDALITNVPHMPLACYYADCMPVLLYDPNKQAIAAIHSGWRGTQQNIIRKTIIKLQETYGTKPQDLIAAVGPSIGSCHMEVGPEVKELFLHSGFDQVISREGKLYLDLWAIARLQLQHAGVLDQQIHIAEICTYCHPEAYYSHRRDGEKRGNHCAVIQLVSKENQMGEDSSI